MDASAGPVVEEGGTEAGDAPNAVFRAEGSGDFLEEAAASEVVDGVFGLGATGSLEAESGDEMANGGDTESVFGVVGVQDLEYCDSKEFLVFRAHEVWQGRRLRRTAIRGVG
jgi:hypothetical protein